MRTDLHQMAERLAAADHVVLGDDLKPVDAPDWRRRMIQNFGIVLWPQPQALQTLPRTRFANSKTQG